MKKAVIILSILVVAAATFFIVNNRLQQASRQELEETLSLLAQDSATAAEAEAAHRAASEAQRAYDILMQQLNNLLPRNTTVSELIFGDLNGDSYEEDCVIITKKGDTNSRRGLAIALQRGEFYEKVWEMPNCFLPENDYTPYYNANGSGYRTGDVSFSIRNGKLIVRYDDASVPDAWWQYVLRYETFYNMMELIGFDSYNTNLPYYESASINFLTSKMLMRNLKEDSKVTKEYWQTLKIMIPLNLKELFLDFRPETAYFESLNAIMFSQDGWYGKLEIISSEAQTNEITNEDIERHCENFIHCIKSGKLKKSLAYFAPEYVKEQHDHFLGGRTNQFLTEFLSGNSLTGEQFIVPKNVSDIN